MKELITKYAKYLLLGLIIYMPLFGHLDTLPFRLWDESRRAMNALEMLQNGHWLIPHFDGMPDMWGTKPPLLIWLQVFFMKLFGVNELAIRLPSALAALFTCSGLLLFGVRYLKEFWLGFIVVLILITSQGYITEHGTRTGDYDALLTFCTTISGLIFFLYLETSKIKYLYSFFFCLSLAILTKSIAGLFFVPGLIIYSLWRQRFLGLLMNKHFYLGLGLLLVIISAYYGFRELYNPGYLDAVQKNELFGRYLTVSESHHHDFWFYFQNLVETQWKWWFLLLPCGAVIGWFHKNEKIRKITVFSSLSVITFWLVISIAQTKIKWYDIPLYPFLSLLAGIAVFFVFDIFRKAPTINHILRFNAVPYLFLFLVTITPYRQMLQKTYLPKEQSWDMDDYEICYFLRDAVKGKLDLAGYSLLLHNFPEEQKQYTPARVYLKMLQKKGVDIQFLDWRQIKPGDQVVAYEEKVKQYIEEHFAHEIIHKRAYVAAYRLQDRTAD